jgi:predicted metal-dependent enzyme (double-stranded beta helix superfamily)
MPRSLSDFVALCQQTIADIEDQHARVEALTPLMRDLLDSGPPPLEPRHRQPDPEGYARRPIHVAGDDELALFAMVWLPGQWTPIHDHGTWGIVGVVDGLLEERAYTAEGGDPDGGTALRLSPSGARVLAAGDVVGFTTRSDHIHMVGVPPGRPTCVSLHLYGSPLNSFNIYDPGTGARQRVGPERH